MSDLSYIITYRSDDEARRANLEAVLAWLRQFPDVEILIVEQARTPTLTDLILPEHGTYRHVINPGPFNKGWGLNIGFQHSTGRVVAFGDADMLMGAAALRESFELCRTTYEAVKPYDQLIDLTPEETQPILAGHQPKIARDGQPPNREGQGEYICFCGGLFVMQRAVFERLGGFDEKFVGWGCEDDALTIKVQALSHNTHTLSGHTAYHLWHAQSPQRRAGQPFYARNAARLRQYQKLDPDALRRLCDEQRQSMGNVHKYEFAASG